jgi:hypothetical protein
MQGPPAAIDDGLGRNRRLSALAESPCSSMKQKPRPAVPRRLTPLVEVLG